MVGVHATHLVLSLIIFVAFMSPAFALSAPRQPVLSAESVLLLDPEGRTVFAKNAEAERAPASLVKMMTLYIAYDELRAGHVTRNEPVTILGGWGSSRVWICALPAH